MGRNSDDGMEMSDYFRRVSEGSEVVYSVVDPSKDQCKEVTSRYKDVAPVQRELYRN